MQKLLAAGLVGGALLMTGSAVKAHHSSSMFDFGLPTELEGAVLEFRYTNPHTTLLLKIKGTDGRSVTWTLEGLSPTNLERAGWTGKALKPGDQIRLTIWPLRSGGTGGVWSPQWVQFQDGKPVR